MPWVVGVVMDATNTRFGFFVSGLNGILLLVLVFVWKKFIVHRDVHGTQYENTIQNTEAPKQEIEKSQGIHERVTHDDGELLFEMGDISGDLVHSPLVQP